MTAKLFNVEPQNSTEAHPIPEPSFPLNLYESDRHLQVALARYYQNDPAGGQWTEGILREWGEICAQQIEPLYLEAERNSPTLKQFDRRGERVDELEFHPAYHAIGKLVYGFGLAAMSNVANFKGSGRPASQLAKFAAMYQFCQVEGSISCPLSMTDIMVRTLNKFASQELIQRYLPRLTSLDYDQLYTGSMFMTEKIGGSDVGATTTVAHRTEDGWELSGDKWFCSNVGAELILTLARPEGAMPGTQGLGLFLVPRSLPDGRRNSYLINRLKDKLGTRGMASGEVTFNRATAYLIEPLERGFVMMMEMVNGTRLHSGVGGVGTLRRSVIEATQHATTRRSFGRTLAEHSLISRQLSRLIVDSEAATSLMLATAHTLDMADSPAASHDGNLLSRLLISLLKRYGTDHGVKAAQSALELRGGNGYIEDWPNARILRDSYVNIIWEGGINMVSFDVLRLLGREGVWPIYAAAIEKELAAINNPALADCEAEVRQTLTELAAETSRIMSGSRELQEVAAPQLAEAMATLYAAVLRLTETEFSFGYDSFWATRSLQSVQLYLTEFLRPSLYNLGQIKPVADTMGLINGTI